MKIDGKQIEAQIDGVMKHVLDEGFNTHRSDPSRVNYLRVSSLPFCGRAWILNQPTARSSKRKETTSTMFYTQVGTTVHNVVQTSLSNLSNSREREHRLPAGALLIQDWICRTCRHRVIFQPAPAICPWCESKESFASLKGDENEVVFSKHLLGHIDGCFAFPHKPDIPYSKEWIHIPIDYKTTSTASLSGNSLPYKGNVIQLLTYGAIKAKEGYNVPGVCLIYISRESPNKRKNCYVALDTEAHVKKLYGYEKVFIEAVEATKEPTFVKLKAIPPKEDKSFESRCSFCKYTKMCQASSEGNDSLLDSQLRVVLTYLKGSRQWTWPKA